MTEEVGPSPWTSVTPPAGTPSVPPTVPPRAGWYPDPADPSHHRWWDGGAWSSQTFPSGPKTSPRASASPWQPAADPGPPPPALAPRPPTTASHWPVRALVIALVVGLIAGFTTVETYRAVRDEGSSSTSADGAPFVPRTNPFPPRSSVPSAPSGPVASALAGLVLQQSDVDANDTVQLLPGGDQVAGETTLDICNGIYPSESLRVARLQVLGADDQGNETLSTEAVAYRSPQATAQAFAELRSVAAACPKAPVTSPVGEPTVATRINAAPDQAWPQTDGVSRVAFDLTVSDQSGQAERSVAVYLRRGRVLLGVYFPNADASHPAVGSARTQADIVKVFAERMRRLPSSVVNG